ncbi:fatty alcohol:caffeoyl-CoA acyltransferase [Cornus florida]|uniref:fatty alcohol:caffeoyl-CoA acyltransferase n=1 Tax=Cornus florida TaxID=4283 RepID=UPI002896EA95|nr:fatty alcohol:caffeoyl-CoA acyltransferase [Cornus florida]
MTPVSLHAYLPYTKDLQKLRLCSPNIFPCLLSTKISTQSSTNATSRYGHSQQSLMALWVEELHFSHLDIPITIDSIATVGPAGPIPVAHGESLYLSNLDDIVGARVFTPTVYFYRPGSLSVEQKQITRVLREALATVLVPYYPFLGRLREAENGKLEVFFGPDQGVLMVEARSTMALANLGDITVPNPAWAPLIFRYPDEEPYKVLDIPLLIAQVTRFSCGGFSLGLRICHCLCDGLGAMQFLTAWAATAKAGALIINPRPCWDREAFRPRRPPMVKYPHMEFMRIDDGSSLTRTLWQVKPVQKCYRISREFQVHLKTLAQPCDDFACTTFDAMAAHVWRSWVKALDVTPPDYKLRLTFSVNARQKVKNPPLKDGFYGNALCVACATRTVSELVNGHLSDTTQLVRQARLGISEEYVRSTIDYVEVERPRRLEFGGKLTITQWTRFSIYECADFGWGRPIYAGPIDLTPTPQVCVFLPDSGGTTVVCICLPESATHKFREFLCLMDSNDH